MSLVSVIMSTYCRNKPDKWCPNMLKRAVDSVLAQTLRDIELVLIDDASTDGTEQVCREYAKKDSRVKYFRAKQNSGMPAVRYNDGMRLASADLFAFMFDDDYLYPDGVRYLYESITGKNNKCDLVYGLCSYLNIKDGRRQVVGDVWDYDRLVRENMFCLFCNLSVIVRRGAINDVGGYDEQPLSRRMCDWDLWVRIGAGHKVAYIPKLIGMAYQGYGDGIGETTPITMPETWAEVVRIQAIPGRPVRLRGEMHLPADAVREGYL